MKNQNRVKFNIVEQIGVLKSGPYSLELNLVEWGNLKAKYDLRDWKLEGGQKMPCKGITLDLEQLRALKGLLNEMEVLKDE